MSEMYEGVVVIGDRNPVQRALAAVRSPLSLRLVPLGEQVFGVYRVAHRQEAFDVPGINDVAAQLSCSLRVALAVFYDNRCGTEKAMLFSQGREGRAFGPEDELWVPLDEEGEPVLEGPRLKPAELQPDQEYDCVRSAIAAGLEALGVGDTLHPEGPAEASAGEGGQRGSG
jgi:hypothetical protein